MPVVTSFHQSVLSPSLGQNISFLGMATDDGEGSPTLDRWICRCRGAVDDQPAGGAEPEPHKAEAAEAAVPPEAGWLARLRCCASSPRPQHLLPEGVPPS